MSELDLIPVRYHRRRLLRGWFVRTMAVYFIVAVGMIGLGGLLSQKNLTYRRQIESIRVERVRADEEQEKLTQLSNERNALGQRIQVLESLRGGVAAKQMFSVVDDSLDARVWFRRWSFRRAGEIVDEVDRAVETGYFIVLPQESSGEPRKTWRFQTHMEIMADSDDHSTLANFVRRLSQQPEIESARILNTKMRNGADSGRVEFELALVVKSSR